MAEETRYNRYKESLDRAASKYMENRRRISVVLTAEMLEEYKAACEAEGISMQGYLRECIEKKIQEH